MTFVSPPARPVTLKVHPAPQPSRQIVGKLLSKEYTTLPLCHFGGVQLQDKWNSTYSTPYWQQCFLSPDPHRDGVPSRQLIASCYPLPPPPLPDVQGKAEGNNKLNNNNKCISDAPNPSMTHRKTIKTLYTKHYTSFQNALHISLYPSLSPGYLDGGYHYLMLWSFLSVLTYLTTSETERGPDRSRRINTQGCSSGGINVPCIYSHARWELP